MINTRKNVFLFDLAHCLVHHGFVAVLDQAHELFGPQVAEVPFDVREDVLNRVQLRLVGQRVDPLELVLAHLGLGPVGDVDAQIVQVDRDRIIAVGGAQVGQVLFELVQVHRALEDLVVLEAALLRNTTK